eukprot:1158702-Pelagomonas_calceolata.AAC.2
MLDVGASIERPLPPIACHNNLKQCTLCAFEMSALATTASAEDMSTLWEQSRSVPRPQEAQKEPHAML